ncbi:hypothetical protein WR25_26558 [Diploscapter pachys]|uniref:BZIP domain-containing protein n=1 Tax=Diploscapter pachys TaxID=2018661 RepID=A0A2A2LT54_9BILA|nr:hypothetical protein WR25_26558 [Diploscapter pachys]
MCSQFFAEEPPVPCSPSALPIGLSEDCPAEWGVWPQSDSFALSPQEIESSVRFSDSPVHQRSAKPHESKCVFKWAYSSQAAVAQCSDQCLLADQCETTCFTSTGCGSMRRFGSSSFRSSSSSSNNGGSIGGGTLISGGLRGIGQGKRGHKQQVDCTKVAHFSLSCPHPFNNSQFMAPMAIESSPCLSEEPFPSSPPSQFNFVSPSPPSFFINDYNLSTVSLDSFQEPFLHNFSQNSPDDSSYNHELLDISKPPSFFDHLAQSPEPFAYIDNMIEEVRSEILSESGGSSSEPSPLQENRQSPAPASVQAAIPLILSPNHPVSIVGDDGQMYKVVLEPVHPASIKSSPSPAPSSSSASSSSSSVPSPSFAAVSAYSRKRRPKCLENVPKPKRAVAVCLASMSEEEISERKKLQNRQAAQKYREKMKLIKAEEEQESEQLESRNAYLKEEAERLQKEIADLRAIIFSSIGKTENA